MARYGSDFMGRGRGMRDRMEEHDPLLDAVGPGAEGYFLSRDMALEAEMDDRRRPRHIEDEGGFPGGMANFGRGNGGDVPTGRGSGCERDAGMRGRGYRADSDTPGFAMGYDRGYRGGFGR